MPTTYVTPMSYSTSLSSSAVFSALPTPSSVKPGWKQVTTQAKRTVGPGAKMKKQLLANKRTLNCTWNLLTPEQYKILDDLHTYNFWQLKYYDPQNLSQMTTRVFYGGDLNAGDIIRYDTNGKPKGYKNASWNFIEQ